MEAPGKGARRWEGRGGPGSGVKLSRGRLSKGRAAGGPEPLPRALGFGRKQQCSEMPSLSGGLVNTCSPIYSVVWVMRWGRGERRVINRRRHEEASSWGVRLRGLQGGWGGGGRAPGEGC